MEGGFGPCVSTFKPIRNNKAAKATEVMATSQIRSKLDLPGPMNVYPPRCSAAMFGSPAAKVRHSLPAKPETAGEGQYIEALPAVQPGKRAVP